MSQALNGAQIILDCLMIFLFVLFLEVAEKKTYEDIIVLICISLVVAQGEL